MNNEYSSGLYGTNVKYFETEMAYQSYKSAGKNCVTPNVSYANLQMIVHYDWDGEIIYDPDEIVLTPTNNSVVYNILKDAGIRETNEDEGYTVSDLATVTLQNIYNDIDDEVDPKPGGGYFEKCSIFSYYDDNTSWTFDEFKYFTGLTVIPEAFFIGCKGLTSITLPHTITSVEYCAFKDCNNLTSITLLSAPTFNISSMPWVGNGSIENNLVPVCVLHCSNSIYNQYKNRGNIVDINDVKILWSDKSVYTIKEYKENKPASGYPIGINIIDNKYVSLKFMNINDPNNGSISSSNMVFGSNGSDEENITYDSTVDRNYGVLSAVKIFTDEILFKPQPVDDNTIISRFKYFNGKEQTEIILNNISTNNYQTGTITNSDEYPTAECVWRFNPGDTEQGDWYIPAIGELVQIYLSAPIINTICSMLVEDNYDDYVYSELPNYYYWSSTFYGSCRVYNMDMYDDYVGTDDKNSGRAVLAMLELATS